MTSNDNDDNHAAVADSGPNNSTMKAVLGKDYGDIDEMISLADGVPRPALKDLPAKKRRNRLLIRVHAVSLACGDVRVLSGRTRELQGPPSMPYVPGGDCSGVVVEVPDNQPQPYFKVGDRVTARFVDGPRGALGEYAIVHQAVCDKIDDEISFVDAAALAGASPAIPLADRIAPGERVLVLGAGGGVGSHLVQLIRDKESGSARNYIVGVSRSPDRLTSAPLSCDAAVDYTKQDVFSMQEYTDDPFDVIVDLASGGWIHLLGDMKKGRKNSIVKPASQGGRYITTTPDTPSFDGHSVWQVLQIFLFPPLFRAIQSRTWRRSRLPKYTFGMSLPEDRSVVTRMLDAVRRKKLVAAVDDRGPFPFTTAGARAAFRLQESRHVHGKVVIEVAK